MPWVVEFYDTLTGEPLKGTGAYYSTFHKAKDVVKENFPDHKIHYTTQGPWQVTTPVQEPSDLGHPEASTLSARIRLFPTWEDYEFYAKVRSLFPGLEDFVSEKIERYETIGQIQAKVAKIIADYRAIEPI